MWWMDDNLPHTRGGSTAPSTVKKYMQESASVCRSSVRLLDHLGISKKTSLIGLGYGSQLSSGTTRVFVESQLVTAARPSADTYLPARIINESGYETVLMRIWFHAQWCTVIDECIMQPQAITGGQHRPQSVESSEDENVAAIKRAVASKHIGLSDGNQMSLIQRNEDPA
ncbi:hypothetical protein C8R44DRAFT_736994 [Mycena epipterygia]|nr:hypothetical protein C8R44DRAFT_736994 [Mycena epipterygia]